MKQFVKRMEEGRGQEEGDGAEAQKPSQDSFKTLDFWISH